MASNPNPSSTPTAPVKRLREVVLPRDIAHLRKLKQLPEQAKAIVYARNQGGPGLAMQLDTDVRLYGVWEALLYIEGYEAQGYYTPGTAIAAAIMCGVAPLAGGAQ